MKQKDSLNKRLNTRLASLVMLSVLSVPWVAGAAGNSVVANNLQRWRAGAQRQG